MLLLPWKSNYSVSTLCEIHRWQPIRLPHPTKFSEQEHWVISHFLQCMKEKGWKWEFTQLCLTLGILLDCSPGGSSCPIGFYGAEYWSEMVILLLLVKMFEVSEFKYFHYLRKEISSFRWLNGVQLFVTTCTSACQAS